MHKTIAIDALRAGKHVLCEKPAARIYSEALEMQKVQHETGKILNIGVVNRFATSVNEVRRRIMSGELGEVYHVFVNFRCHRSIPGIGGAFTTKAISGGGVLIDWGIHFLDLILYVLGEAKLLTVTCDAYNKMATDMKSYHYHSMWAEDTKDVEHGVNDVDDFITGYVRTDKASISFNGAWAENLDKVEMFIDFLGDKGGARLNYGGLYEFCNGETLETERPEYEIPNMYACEDRAFLDSTISGVKTKSNIDYVLESAKLLDRLYASAAASQELDLQKGE